MTTLAAFFSKKGGSSPKKRKPLPHIRELIPLTYYLSQLEKTTPVLFPFMTKEQRDKLLLELNTTKSRLHAQIKHERKHQKTENYKVYKAKIKQCWILANRLNHIVRCENNGTTPNPTPQSISDDSPVSYMGLLLGGQFAKLMVHLSERKTKSIKDLIGWINEQRLYWVWSSVLLKANMSLLPADFFNADKASNAVRAPDPYTGTLSWSLYYFRFALNLGLLLKHTIQGPWMSKEEAKTPWTERFKTQWEYRKFSLLNDSVWATGNMLCFFWLVGKGAMGSAGDMLTIGLLLFDITLAVWDYEEQKTQYKNNCEHYTNKLNELIAKAKKQEETLTKLNAKAAEQERCLNEDFKSPPHQDVIALSRVRRKIRDAEKTLATTQHEIEALKRVQTQTIRDWKYKNITLATNIAYAVGLVLAFTLLTGPFFPIAAGAVMAMTVAGAALCFALSVISNGIKGGIEIHKMKAITKEMKEDQKKLIKQFKLIQVSDDNNIKKLAYLNILKLQAETRYQERVLTNQSMKLILSVTIQALVPAIIFVSVVFLPLGIGLPLLAAAIVFAALVYQLINSKFNTEKEPDIIFDEKAYETFCNQHPCSENEFTAKEKTQPEMEEPSMTDDSDDEADPLLAQTASSIAQGI